MYKQSNDLRFIKNREALQRAFIDLTLEKRSTRITVKELSERADVNRMTFYLHYERVADILLELIDGMTAELIACQPKDARLDIETLLTNATVMMQAEIEFYRLAAQNDQFEFYRAQFRKGFEKIFAEELEQTTSLTGAELQLAAGMLASSLTYAYLDWLAGNYGELSLEDLITFCQQTLQHQIALWL